MRTASTPAVAATWILSLLASVPSASAQLITDDFSNGTPGPLWVKESVAGVTNVSIIERNSRLEGVITSIANPPSGLVTSSYTSSGWQFRSDQPFRFKLAFRQQSATTDVNASPLGDSAGILVEMFPSQLPPMSTTGLRPGFGAAIFTYGITAPNRFNEPAGTYRQFSTFSADFTTAASGDIATLDEAYAELGAQTVFFDVENGLPAPSIPIAGTLYFRFFPDADLIAVTANGYATDPFDPDAYVIPGVTGGFVQPLQLSLGVFSGVGKTLSGANTFWDTFSFDEGVIETAVSNLQASDGTSDTGVQLTWDVPQNANSIDIFREYPGSGFPIYLASVAATETSYFDSLVDPIERGVVWNYTLVTDTGLISEDAGWAFGPPQGVMASDGDFATGVEVRWDVLPGASSYRVLRSETGSDPVLVGSPTTSPYLDTTAVAGVVYDYSVEVVKGTAVSEPSFSDSGYRGTPGPTGLVASDGTREDGILLTWNAVAGADQYEIFKEVEPDSFFSIGFVSPNQFLADGFSVTAGRGERFKVRAIVGGQTTALSNADTGWWIPKPYYFYASDGYESGPVTLSWVIPFSPDVTYKIYRAAGTATPTTQIGTSPDGFYVDESAVAGQLYSYRVRGTCSLGDGPFSDVDTGQAFVPGRPLSVEATDGTLLTGVRVDWEPDPSQFGIANYRVYRTSYGTYPPPPATLVGTVAGNVSTYTDTTAVAGVAYEYEVRARYSSGVESTGNPSDYGWRGLPAPTGVVATAGTRADGVNLTWTAVTGAAGYRIFRVGTGGQIVVVGTAVSASFLDTTAPVGILQSYRVAAVGPAGDSSPSSPASGWRNVAAPISAAASDGTSTTTIVVEWPPVSGASGYRVLRVAGSGAPTQVIAEISNPEQTVYNDVHNATSNNLVAGTLYNYAVQARCALGNSVSSPTNTGWRNVPAPGSIVASDGTLTTGVQVTWPTVAGATGYRVFRGTSPSNLVSIATPTASPYVDTTAVAGTTYLYAVAARTAAGDSPSSGTDSGWRNIAAPTAVLATDGTLPSGVNVTWTAAVGATQYRIYRALSSAPANPVAVGTVTSSPFLDVSAEVGVQYAYTVRSVSASGESAPSAADNGWRTIEAPAGILATDGTLTNAVQVTWNAVGGATGYRVYRAIGAATPTEISPTGSFTATSFTDATAVAGTLYRYTVRARTTLGNSLSSSPDDGWKNIAAPASIVASDGTSTAHVALSWPAVTGATGYSIYRRVGSGPFDAPINATGTTFNDTTATVGVLYTYLVRAKTAAGQSAESPTDTGWRNATAPTAVAATDGELDNGVRITWNSVPGFGPYKVYRAIGTGTPQLLTPFGFAGSPFVDETAEPLTTYSYTVTTVTAAGDSVPSTANTGWRNIPAPTGLVASEGNPASIAVTWNAVAGSTGYRLYRAIGTAAPTEITPAASFTATSFTDTTAANATVYTYTVRARHALGNTLPSAADTGFKTMPAPAGVAASDGTTTEGVVVTWTPIPGVSTYRIFRALGAAAPVNLTPVPASGPSFLDTTGITGTIYSYTVRGVFNGAESPASTANTGWRTLPAPASVVASDGTSTANVAISWPAISAVPGHTAYRVYRQLGSAAATAIHTTPNITTTSFNDTTAVAGTPYTYSVRSVMAAGESASNPSDAGWRNVPGPATLAATDGTVTTGVNLTWAAVTGVTSYRVHRGIATDGSDLAPIGSVSGVTTFADITALPGVTYRYRILLTTAAGDSSSTSLLDPGWRNVPAPTGFLASDGTSTSAVNLNWNAVPGASSYRLERGIGATFSVLADTAESAFVDATAAAGTIYTYRIRARTPSGDSLVTVTDTGWRALPAPASIAASDGTSTVNVTVTWPSIGSAVAGHTGYRVYRGTSGSTLTLLATVAANVTNYVDATAVGGTPYTYSVRSLTAAGESSGNPTDTGWKNVLAPANVQATDGTRTDGVNVTWTAVTGATGYRILRGTGPSDLVELATVTGIAFLDTTAEPGLTYHYGAQTVTAAGLSATSTPTNTGWRNVPAPAAFAAGDGTSTFGIELSWEEVEDATGYEIYRAAGSAVPTVLIATITDPTETTYDDYHSPPSNSLPAGSLFNYVVKAKTASGLSAGSPANTGWRNIPSPEYLYASEGESLTKVDLEWESIGTGVQGHTGYRVYRRTGEAAFVSLATLPVTATTYSDLTAAVGTPYEYKVAATSAAGDSYEAPTADGWRNVPAPTGFAASDNLPDRISMSWLPVNSTAVTGYRIYIYDMMLGSLVPIGTVGPTETVFETTEYFFGDFSVRAMTAAGESDLSNFDQGSITALMGMTGVADLPDGRLNAGGGTGSQVPDGKNGEGSGVAESLDRDAPEPGRDQPTVDRPRPVELTCEQILGRISATLTVLETSETEVDRTLAARLSAILETDPDDPMATIPACAMHEGDVNLDGSVDFLDLEAFLVAWSDGDVVLADLDRDGTIDDRDWDLLSRRLMRAAVEEPAVD